MINLWLRTFVFWQQMATMTNDDGDDDDGDESVYVFYVDDVYDVAVAALPCQ